MSPLRSLPRAHHAVNRRRQAHERPPAPCALRLGPSNSGNVQSLRKPRPYAYAYTTGTRTITHKTWKRRVFPCYLFVYVIFVYFRFGLWAQTLTAVETRELISLTLPIHEAILTYGDERRGKPSPARDRSHSATISTKQKTAISRGHIGAGKRGRLTCARATRRFSSSDRGAVLREGLRGHTARDREKSEISAQKISRSLACLPVGSVVPALL